MTQDAGALVGVRVALQLRLHPDAVVIVVGRMERARPLLQELAPYRPALASLAFAEDLPLAMVEGVTLYDAGALREQGPAIAERRTAILVEDQDVRVLERA